MFKPGQRPWIRPEGASTAAIVAQVGRCPSGALSLRYNESAELAAVSAINRIEVSANGPLIVKGPCLIAHPDGQEEERQGPTALCRCGASARKPFCDGSHRRIDFGASTVK